MSNMMCLKPYWPSEDYAVGCGQCLPCRINKKREWAHRLYLESLLNDRNCFVTLTYNEENLPPNGTLVKKEAQGYLKRLRYYMKDKFRYYMVGEYGNKTERPHYHIVIFGHGLEQLVNYETAWYNAGAKKGNIDVHDLSPELCNYICGYVTKKWTNKKDKVVQEKLKGREPEFATMSRRPGIATGAVEVITNALNTINEEILDDVPDEIRIGGKKYFISSFLKKKIRKEYGFTEEYIELLKKNKIKDLSEEIQFRINEQKQIFFETGKVENRISKVNKIKSLEQREKLAQTKRNL